MAIKDKKWRMESAKLAKAYLNGGEPSYQAARKAGFMRVAEMEAAIRELERKEGAESEVRLTTEEQAIMDGSKFLPGNEVLADFKTVPVPEEVPEKESVRGSFAARMYPSSPGRYRMIRLWGWMKNAFIMFRPEEIDDLRAVLAELTGDQAPESGETHPESFPEMECMGLQAEVTRLQAELGAVKMQLAQEQAKNRELITDAQVNASRAKGTTEELIAANATIDRLKARVVELETSEKVHIYEEGEELLELREENRRLKDKLIDMIME